VIMTMGSASAKDVVGPGGRFLPLWPVQGIVKLPTPMQQLELGEAVIVTAGNDDDPDAHNSVSITVNVCLNFGWPQQDDPNDVLQAIKIFEDSEDLRAVKNVLQEPTLELVRRVCREMNWQEVYAAGDNFRRKIDEIIKDEESHPIVVGRLRNPSVFITGIQMPPDLQEKLHAQEIARLERKADEELADKEAYRIKKVGAAEKQVRKNFFELAQLHPGPEAVRGFVEASMGTANTIMMLSTDLANALQNVAGGPKAGDALAVPGVLDGNKLKAVVAALPAIFRALPAEERDGMKEAFLSVFDEIGLRGTVEGML